MLPSSRLLKNPPHIWTNLRLFRTRPWGSRPVAIKCCSVPPQSRDWDSAAELPLSCSCCNLQLSCICSMCAPSSHLFITAPSDPLPPRATIQACYHLILRDLRVNGDDPNFSTVISGSILGKRSNSQARCLSWARMILEKMDRVELLLLRTLRTTLSHFRSGYCARLHNYRHSFPTLLSDLLSYTPTDTPFRPPFLHSYRHSFPARPSILQGYLLLSGSTSSLSWPLSTDHGCTIDPSPDKTGGRPALPGRAPRVLFPTLCLGRSPGRLHLGHSVVSEGNSSGCAFVWPV